MRQAQKKREKDKVQVALILAFCVGAILIGGLKRIATVSQIIVPFMAIIYFLFAIILIICNLGEVPGAIKIIVTERRLLKG